MNESKVNTPSLFSKYDKIGVVLLVIGGFGFLYDSSPMLGHFLSGDFQHLSQPELLPEYLSIPIFITAGIGIFLTMRMCGDSEGLF